MGNTGMRSEDIGNIENSIKMLDLFVEVRFVLAKV